MGLFTVLTAMLAIYGCSDEFLQDTKTNGISDTSVYAEQATTIATVTGIYDGFQGAYGGQPGIPAEYNTKSIFKLNRLTQDWKGNGTDENFIDFDISPDEEIMGKMWPVHYNAIGRANAALLNLPGAIENGVVDSELGNRLIGEALVLRSILYYYLASTMGGVPIVLEDSNNPFAPRSTQDEVFQQLVSDLETAAPNLPWSYDNEKGRVTRGTAYAYLGSCYMWLGEYDKAVDAFEQLEGHYFLEENFLNIHAHANKNGKESLFEIQFDDEGDLGWNRNSEKTFLQSFIMPAEINGGCYGGLPTAALYNSFEDGDLRRDYTIIPPGGEHPDPLINISDYPGVQDNYGGINTLGTEAEPWLGTDGSTGRTGYYSVKLWRNPSTSGWNGPNIFGGQNHIWLRYGEVLISLAEAAFRSGDTGKALDALTQVRNRAWGGIAPPIPGGLSLDAIIKEYRHEIGGEFSLWPTLRRVGDEDAVEAAFGITIDSGAKNMLLPIPRGEIDINNSLKQNPGY